MASLARHTDWLVRMTAPENAAELLQGVGGFIVKRWRVNVVGYGGGCYDAATRGRAMSQAWRCDAFGHLKFGDFLKIARCYRDRDLPARWGDPITVGGRPAFFLENNRQYVWFAYPGWAAPSNAHPYDVLPVEYRPDTYRDRDVQDTPRAAGGEK